MGHRSAQNQTAINLCKHFSSKVLVLQIAQITSANKVGSLTFARRLYEASVYRLDGTA